MICNSLRTVIWNGLFSFVSSPNMMTTGLQSNIIEMLIANADFFFPGGMCSIDVHVLYA